MIGLVIYSAVTKAAGPRLATASSAAEEGRGGKGGRGHAYGSTSSGVGGDSEVHPLLRAAGRS